MAPTLDDRINQLLEFEAREGHMFVPRSHTKEGLGRWVNNTRTTKNNGKLKDSEMISRLDEIGFAWEVPKGPAKQELIEWGKHFKFLVGFHKTKGHCNVPATIGGKPIPAAAWCDTQRALFLEQKLEQDKVDKLSKLDFDFYWSGEESKEPATKRQRVDSDSEAFKNLQEEVQALKAENEKLKLEISNLKA